jgi:hypothetical protein
MVFEYTSDLGLDELVRLLDRRGNRARACLVYLYEKLPPGRTSCWTEDLFVRCGVALDASSAFVGRTMVVASDEQYAGACLLRLLVRLGEPTSFNDLFERLSKLAEGQGCFLRSLICEEGDDSVDAFLVRYLPLFNGEGVFCNDLVRLIRPLLGGDAGISN